MTAPCVRLTKFPTRRVTFKRKTKIPARCYRFFGLAVNVRRKLPRFRSSAYNKRPGKCFENRKNNRHSSATCQTEFGTLTPRIRYVYNEFIRLGTYLSSQKHKNNTAMLKSRYFSKSAIIILITNRYVTFLDSVRYSRGFYYFVRN